MPDSKRKIVHENTDSPIEKRRYGSIQSNGFEAFFELLNRVLPEEGTRSSRILTVVPLTTVDTQCISSVHSWIPQLLRRPDAGPACVDLDIDHETTTGEVEKAVRVEKSKTAKGKTPY